MSTQFNILIGILFTFAILVVLIILGAGMDTRMNSLQASFAGRGIERGAEYFETYCYTCHGEQGQGVPGRGPVLNRKDLLDTKNSAYLKYIKFGGTLSDFLHDTIAAGRPQPSAFYSNEGYAAPMPTWSQDYGGPLRPDQIDSLVSFVMNWSGEYPSSVALPSPGVTPTAAPTGVANATPPFPLPPSQAVLDAGKAVYVQKDKCVICHGENLDGKGIAGASLSPPPRNFTDCAAMQQFSLSQHHDAIANGKPPNMPAWKSKLTDEQIWQITMYERSVCSLFTP